MLRLQSNIHLLSIKLDTIPLNTVPMTFITHTSELFTALTNKYFLSIYLKCRPLCETPRNRNKLLVTVPAYKQIIAGTEKEIFIQVTDSGFYRQKG